MRSSSFRGRLNFNGGERNDLVRDQVFEELWICFLSASAVALMTRVAK